MRDRAGVARWAHNPKVVGSNPSPATKEDSSVKTTGEFSFSGSQPLNKPIDASFVQKRDKRITNWKDNIDNKFVPADQFLFTTYQSKITTYVIHKKTGTQF